MTNNAIIVNYDPFAMESKVSIFTNGNQEQVNICSEIGELAEKLIALAYQYNTYAVKIHAPFATTSEIKRAVEQNEKSTYSNNKIDIEGI